MNPVVYSACIHLSDFMFRTPVLALAIASVTALTVNHQGAKRHAINT